MKRFLVVCLLCLTLVGCGSKDEGGSADFQNFMSTQYAPELAEESTEDDNLAPWDANSSEDERVDVSKPSDTPVVDGFKEGIDWSENNMNSDVKEFMIKFTQEMEKSAGFRDKPSGVYLSEYIAEEQQVSEDVAITFENIDKAIAYMRCYKDLGGEVQSPTKVQWSSMNNMARLFGFADYGAMGDSDCDGGLSYADLLKELMSSMTNAFGVSTDSSADLFKYTAKFVDSVELGSTDEEESETYYCWKFEYKGSNYIVYLPNVSPNGLMIQNIVVQTSDDDKASFSTSFSYSNIYADWDKLFDEVSKSGFVELKNMESCYTKGLAGFICTESYSISNEADLLELISLYDLDNGYDYDKYIYNGEDSSKEHSEDVSDALYDLFSEYFGMDFTTIDEDDLGLSFSGSLFNGVEDSSESMEGAENETN